MGKKITRPGNAAAGLKLPLSSDLKIRANGARVKHRLGPNSIQLYDKAYEEAGAVLRAELTMSQAKYFRVQRGTDDPHAAVGWRPLRQGVADMPLRVQVSDAAVDRYCSSLATVDDSSTLEELTAAVQRRCRWKADPCVPSIPLMAQTTPCYRPSSEVSFKSAASATAICRPCFTPLRPRTKKKSGSVPPLSVASCECSAPTV